jgi:hypothetical protein
MCILEKILGYKKNFTDSMLQKMSKHRSIVYLALAYNMEKYYPLANSNILPKGAFFGNTNVGELFPEVSRLLLRYSNLRSL